MTKNTLYIDSKNLELLKKYLSIKRKMVALAHANPDGDTIGATIALTHGLRQLGHDITMACYDQPDKKFAFLPDLEFIQNNFDEQAYEAVIFIDCGHKKMAKFPDSKPRIISDDMVKINIDHHPSNDFFGEINFVNTNACSSAVIVFHLLQKLELKITPVMATALLLGIYWDTGSFMHQNTTPESYKAAAELVKMGGNIAKISRNIFHHYEFKTLKLWAKVLQDLYLTPEGAAIVGVSRKDFESIGASREDLGGIIDFINAMPEAEYSVLLSEDEKGNVKASLRTRKPNVDVKALAEKFGGGGHVKASGFTIKGGKLQKEVKWKIVQD